MKHGSDDIDHTFSLDGAWTVIFDYDNKGRTCNWQERENFEGYHEIEPVSVPACLEEFQRTHRLVENLGHDPVAERLFSNLVRWAVSG